MNKINVHLEYCYGIKKLEHEFDFSKSNSIALYAPNGTMKTSFANVFNDISNNLLPKDRINPNKEVVCEIKDESSHTIEGNQVYVIEPYADIDKSAKISTLLVKKDLKEQYDTIHLDIDNKKVELLKELKPLSGLTRNIDNEISDTFYHLEGKFFNSLGRIENDVLDGKSPGYIGIRYVDIFNDKVIEFLSQKDVIKDLNDYLEKYDELLEKSQFFQKGIFNHNNATVIAKNLKDNGFFQAHHSVFLNSQESNNKEINTESELIEIIDAEKESILTDPELQKKFNDLDKKLTKNAALKSFREFISNNTLILPELARLENFRQKLWISYLKECKDLYSKTLNSYKSAQEKIELIIKQANSEQERWIKVVSDFNKRFSVPFRVKISNQSDVILNDDVPILSFTFKDENAETPIDRNKLINILSSGERKALYLLNILFEVEARKSDSIETIFIIDDIADSFDYKNKYAIIEYLMDIEREDYFKQIVLTHNFDFFRTVESRYIKYKNCLMVEKNKNDIIIKEANYIRNPFNNYWMKNLDTDDNQLIATIPFVRNIIEYTRDVNNDDYKTLTSLLHILPKSFDIKKSDLQNIYKNIFDKTIDLSDPDKQVIGLIFELADGCIDSCESINLEFKILLSIAIRLKAEIYMIDKIKDKSITDNVGDNQTKKLFNIFKHKIDDENIIKVLDQVNLMTPENIHFNSFMYEPILDMSDEHLKTLYTSVISLN